MLTVVLMCSYSSVWFIRFKEEMIVYIVTTHNWIFISGNELFREVKWMGLTAFIAVGKSFTWENNVL